ncbi:MAG: VOC family protein [Pseudomonadales bacterium]
MTNNALLAGVHHVSINVSDVAAAKAFYVDLLGMQDLPRPDFPFPGAWLGIGGQELHLLGIESTAPPKEQHFALAVTDLAALRQQLAEAGVAVSEPTEIAGVCLQSFAHDPSGNMVEFNQRL